MIQFNLLPDVKLEFIRSKRIKRNVTMIAVLIGAFSVGLLLLMFIVVNGVQKSHMKNLDKNIETLSSDLKKNEELNKILTVQNQLASLPELHESKPKLSRLKTFLAQLRPTDPAEVSYGIVDVNTVDNLITITGTSDTFKSVNTLVDAFKFVKYSVDGEVKEEPFTNVVISDFGVIDGIEGEDSNQEDGATYVIEMTYDPVIFDNTKNIELILKDQVTTRSLIGRPLFESVEVPKDNSEEIDVQLEGNE